MGESIANDSALNALLSRQKASEFTVLDDICLDGDIFDPVSIFNNHGRAMHGTRNFISKICLTHP